ncbi:MAG: hypothetical protein KAJ17_11655, partial [Candidatus Krumholzibacteria bacterium]|nr:hypothetical protein [Candidatus Krumholzibacteria bacterium]
VSTSAESSDRRYTPASSAPAHPTRTLGSDGIVSFSSMLRRPAALNLDAQPAQAAYLVNRIRSLGFNAFLPTKTAGAPAAVVPDGANID